MLNGAQHFLVLAAMLQAYRWAIRSTAYTFHNSREGQTFWIRDAQTIVKKQQMP